LLQKRAWKRLGRPTCGLAPRVSTVRKSSREEEAMKTPGTAAVLSFLIPGVGQIYNGKFLRALFWLIYHPRALDRDRRYPGLGVPHHLCVHSPFLCQEPATKLAARCLACARGPSPEATPTFLNKIPGCSGPRIRTPSWRSNALWLRPAEMLEDVYVARARFILRLRIESESTSRTGAHWWCWRRHC
jgi:hypothetical protein